VVDIVPEMGDSAAKGRCPICGSRVRRGWLHSLASGGHSRVERGRCRGGHRLTRVHGTVIGPWEPVESTDR
jgi:hypothetical protein